MYIARVKAADQDRRKRNRTDRASQVWHEMARCFALHNLQAWSDANTSLQAAQATGNDFQHLRDCFSTVYPELAESIERGHVEMPTE